MLGASAVVKNSELPLAGRKEKSCVQILIASGLHAYRESWRGADELLAGGEMRGNEVARRWQAAGVRVCSTAAALRQGDGSPAACACSVRLLVCAMPLLNACLPLGSRWPLYRQGRPAPCPSAKQNPRRLNRTELYLYQLLPPRRAYLYLQRADLFLLDCTVKTNPELHALLLETASV